MGGGARLGSRSRGEGTGVPPGQCRGGRGSSGGACGPASPRGLSGAPTFALGVRRRRGDGGERTPSEEGGAGQQRGLGVEDGWCAGGSECFERRKWRLVQVPPLPARSPLFATSHAPSDQPVFPLSSTRFQSPGSSRLPGSARPLPGSWCLAKPSCHTEFMCPLVLIYFHLVFSNPPPHRHQRPNIRFLSLLYNISSFSIIFF